MIPEERLKADAVEAAEISALLGEHPIRAEEDALAEGLLAWFKQDFFSWVSFCVLFSKYDAPQCLS